MRAGSRKGEKKGRMGCFYGPSKDSYGDPKGCMEGSTPFGNLFSTSLGILHTLHDTWWSVGRAEGKWSEKSPRSEE